MMSIVTGTETETDPAVDFVRGKILNHLRNYPGITRSMIGAHIAPYDSQYGVSWRQILDDLVDSGRIVCYAVKLPDNGNRATIQYRLKD